MTFQTAYPENKTRVTTTNNSPSMTKQSLADSADINKIIKKYHKTNIMPDLNKLEATYGEITSDDLQTATQKVMDANDAFMEVPSIIRMQFNNDAGSFINYATNPDNIDQMVEWRLAKYPDGYLNTDGTLNTDGDIKTSVNEPEAPVPEQVPNPPVQTT